MISIADLHWTAGFLEGEGWFGTANKGKSPRIVAAQVQKEPITRLHQLFGGSLRLNKSKRKDWQDTWYWELCGIRAAGLMMTLFSLLTPKRQEQIRKSLAVWRTLPPRAPKGFGLRNPQSPLYAGPSGRWKCKSEKAA